MRAAIDTSNLTWRDKLRIVDITSRIAASMFLALAVLSKLLLIAITLTR